MSRVSRRTGSSIARTVFVSTLALVVLALGLTTLSYFAVVSTTTRTLTVQQAQEINKQIVLNFERYIDSVIETATFLQTAFSSRDVRGDAQPLQELFSLNEEIKRDVVSIVLFDDRGRRILGSQVKPGEFAVLPGAAWFHSAITQPEIYHFDVGASLNASIEASETVLTVSRRVQYLRDDVLLPGVLLVELNTAAITELSDKTNLGEWGHILILDDADALVYDSADTQYSRASLEIARGIYLGGFETRIEDTDVYVYTNTLANSRWRIATVSNIDRINVARRQLLAIIAAIALFVLVLTAGVAALVSVRVSRPIQALQAMMARVETGQFETSMEIRGQREIVELSESFARMVVRVRELMDRLVSEQRDKRKTELRALQNQINPHFLYNTLDSIVWLAEHDRSRDVVTTVVALAKFFRISISKGETFIPVREEIEHIRNYLTIQQIRYVDKFAYVIDIDSSIEEQRVMKLMLQPLVENAIHHGTGDEHGEIHISGRRSETGLVFAVRNSGYGLTEERISRIWEAVLGNEGGSGVGLRNVYRRIKLYYGEAAQMSITSDPDESTTVSIAIPYAVPED